MPLSKKIVFLSRTLKYLSAIGIVLFPLFNYLYWIHDISTVSLGINFWQIQFSNLPPVDLGRLSLKMKVIGFMIDLIPCIFFMLILMILTYLFKNYERLYFFSKKNVHFIQWIAILLFCKMVLHPFYLGLRIYMFPPLGEGHIVNLFSLGGFKELIITMSSLLIAYVTEAALLFEEDFINTI